MHKKVVIAGVGMVPFCKPGQSPSYDLMGAQAARAALADAGIPYGLVEQAFVGYVFGDHWADKNLPAIQGFLRAAAKANELLATSNEEWDRLKPLMAEHDPSFTESTFEALRRRYREGIPERSSDADEADAKVLYQFLRELGGKKLVGTGTELAPGTFWQGATQ